MRILVTDGMDKTALAKLKETGEFQKLYKQWFNTDAPNLPATAEEALK